MIFSEILWAKYLLVCLASIFIFTKKISTKTPTKPLCCFCTGSNKLHGCRKHLQLPNTHARVHTYIRKYIRTYSSHCRRVTFACCYFCKLSQACCGFFFFFFFLQVRLCCKYDCACNRFTMSIFATLQVILFYLAIFSYDSLHLERIIVHLGYINKMKYNKSKK